ncbi:unnamed protein product [Toxocara canis]|uniref:PH domain-containing protein n=1 Tax=Toxocara canis TaxID=6265 RepID=A0A183UQ46_TOXCA|nr:unnamed protein product [Toxocara canis]
MQQMDKGPRRLTGDLLHLSTASRKPKSLNCFDFVLTGLKKQHNLGVQQLCIASRAHPRCNETEAWFSAMRAMLHSLSGDRFDADSNTATNTEVTSMSSYSHSSLTNRKPGGAIDHEIDYDAERFQANANLFETIGEQRSPAGTPPAPGRTKHVGSTQIVQRTYNSLSDTRIWHASSIASTEPTRRQPQSSLRQQPKVAFNKSRFSSFSPAEHSSHDDRNYQQPLNSDNSISEVDISEDQPKIDAQIHLPSAPQDRADVYPSGKNRNSVLGKPLPATSDEVPAVNEHLIDWPATTKVEGEGRSENEQKELSSVLPSFENEPSNKPLLSVPSAESRVQQKSQPSWVLRNNQEAELELPKMGIGGPFSKPRPIAATHSNNANPIAIDEYDVPEPIISSHNNIKSNDGSAIDTDNEQRTAAERTVGLPSTNIQTHSQARFKNSRKEMPQPQKVSEPPSDIVSQDGSTSSIDEQHIHPAVSLKQKTETQNVKIPQSNVNTAAPPVPQTPAIPPLYADYSFEDEASASDRSRESPASTDSINAEELIPSSLENVVVSSVARRKSIVEATLPTLANIPHPGRPIMNVAENEQNSELYVENIDRNSPSSQAISQLSPKSQTEVVIQSVAPDNSTALISEGTPLEEPSSSTTNAQSEAAEPQSEKRQPVVSHKNYLENGANSSLEPSVSSQIAVQNVSENNTYPTARLKVTENVSRVRSNNTTGIVASSQNSSDAASLQIRHYSLPSVLPDTVQLMSTITDKYQTPQRVPVPNRGSLQTSPIPANKNSKEALPSTQSPATQPVAQQAIVSPQIEFGLDDGSQAGNKNSFNESENKNSLYEYTVAKAKMNATSTTEEIAHVNGENKGNDVIRQSDDDSKFDFSTVTPSEGSSEAVDEEDLLDDIDSLLEAQKQAQSEIENAEELLEQTLQGSQQSEMYEFRFELVLLIAFPKRESYSWEIDPNADQMEAEEMLRESVMALNGLDNEFVPVEMPASSFDLPQAATAKSSVSGSSDNSMHSSDNSMPMSVEVVSANLPNPLSIDAFVVKTDPELVGQPVVSHVCEHVLPTTLEHIPCSIASNADSQTLSLGVPQFVPKQQHSSSIDDSVPLLHSQMVTASNLLEKPIHSTTATKNPTDLAHQRILLNDGKQQLDSLDDQDKAVDLRSKEAEEQGRRFHVEQIQLNSPVESGSIETSNRSADNWGTDSAGNNVKSVGELNTMHTRGSPEMSSDSMVLSLFSASKLLSNQSESQAASTRDPRRLATAGEVQDEGETELEQFGSLLQRNKNGRLVSPRMNSIRDQSTDKEFRKVDASTGITADPIRISSKIPANSSVQNVFKKNAAPTKELNVKRTESNVANNKEESLETNLNDRDRESMENNQTMSESEILFVASASDSSPTVASRGEIQKSSALHATESVIADWGKRPNNKTETAQTINASHRLSEMTVDSVKEVPNGISFGEQEEINDSLKRSEVATSAGQEAISKMPTSSGEFTEPAKRRLVKFGLDGNAKSTNSSLLLSLLPDPLPFFRTHPTLVNTVLLAGLPSAVVAIGEPIHLMNYLQVNAPVTARGLSWKADSDTALPLSTTRTAMLNQHIVPEKGQSHFIDNTQATLHTQMLPISGQHIPSSFRSFLSSQVEKESFDSEPKRFSDADEARSASSSDAKADSKGAFEFSSIVEKLKDESRQAVQKAANMQRYENPNTNTSLSSGSDGKIIAPAERAVSDVLKNDEFLHPDVPSDQTIQNVMPTLSTSTVQPIKESSKMSKKHFGIFIPNEETFQNSMTKTAVYSRSSSDASANAQSNKQNSRTQSLQARAKFANGTSNLLRTHATTGALHANGIPSKNRALLSQISPDLEIPSKQSDEPSTHAASPRPFFRSRSSTHSLTVSTNTHSTPSTKFPSLTRPINNFGSSRKSIASSSLLSIVSSPIAVRRPASVMRTIAPSVFSSLSADSKTTVNILHETSEGNLRNEHLQTAANIVNENALGRLEKPRLNTAALFKGGEVTGTTTSRLLQRTSRSFARLMASTKSPGGRKVYFNTGRSDRSKIAASPNKSNVGIFLQQQSASNDADIEMQTENGFPAFPSRPSDGLTHVTNSLLASTPELTTMTTTTTPALLLLKPLEKPKAESQPTEVPVS